MEWDATRWGAIHLARSEYLDAVLGRAGVRRCHELGTHPAPAMDLPHCAAECPQAHTCAAARVDRLRELLPEWAPKKTHPSPREYFAWQLSQQAIRPSALPGDAGIVGRMVFVVRVNPQINVELVAERADVDLPGVIPDVGWWWHGRRYTSAADALRGARAHYRGVS